MLWNRLMCVICVFGFLKEFRPSESFVSPYLNGHWKNFTEFEINQKIYPVSTYSNLILLVVVFLLTDWLRYKPVIILEGIAGIITWSILPSCHSITLIQISQFFYGLFCATEVAFYGYLYAKTERKNYQRATSLTKSTLLLGKASSSFISQVLVLFGVLDYHQLNYLTLGAMLLGTFWALFLPPVAQSAYFHRAKSINAQDYDLEVSETNELKPRTKVNENQLIKSEEHSPADSCLKRKNYTVLHPFLYLLSDFKDSIKNKHIIKWSLWWALSLCGYLQVTNYMQLLWQAIINRSKIVPGVYHGFSTCANCLVGAVCTYLVGFLKLKWDVYGEIVLAFCAIFQGSILLYAVYVDDLIKEYFLYMIFRVLYQTSSTIASAQIARHIKAESYALVFGLSTFVALLVQSFIIAIVIEALKLHIATQFIIYANYYIVIGVGFLISGIITLIHLKTRKKEIADTSNPA